MGATVVLSDIRVQKVPRRGGRVSWTILWPDGELYYEADRFLSRYEAEPGTQRTYAYLLVDHLRWLRSREQAFAGVRLTDLERYMGLVGADVRMPLGEPWRDGKRPYGSDALSGLACCLKRFYLDLALLGINTELGRQLDLTRLPSRADRSRALLGHVKAVMPANPLSPRKVRRRHPKMLPDDARGRLLGAASRAATCSSPGRREAGRQRPPSIRFTGMRTCTTLRSRQHCGRRGTPREPGPPARSGSPAAAGVT
jgi:hypothetical protein